MNDSLNPVANSPKNTPAAVEPENAPTEPSSHNVLDDYEEILPLEDDCPELSEDFPEPYEYGIPEPTSDISDRVPCLPPEPEDGTPYIQSETENRAEPKRASSNAQPKQSAAAEPQQVSSNTQPKQSAAAEPKQAANTQPKQSAAAEKEERAANTEPEQEATEEKLLSCLPPLNRGPQSWYDVLASKNALKYENDELELYMFKHFIPLDLVQPTEHYFLMGDKRFPIGEVSIIAGAGGTGKSQLAAAHMAATSNGCNLQGVRIAEAENCMIITAEDSASDVRNRFDRSILAPKMSRIYVQDKNLSLKFDLNLNDICVKDSKLEYLIDTTHARLVYIDPFQAFVGETTDLSRQNHVRQIMHSLAALAERRRCCIVLLMHLNKRQSIITAADLLCGSSDIVNAARSVMLLTNDFQDGDPDKRYLFHIKSNHARAAKTLELSICDAGNRIVGESELTAEDYVVAVNNRRLAKAAKKEVDYEKLFYSGIEQMIAEGKTQITFREFIERFAPSFPGKAKLVFDDIAARVEERLGYIIQTRTANRNQIKFDNESGFRLCRLS